MKMTKEELAAKLEAHAKWLKTRYTDHVEGERANLMGANLMGADLTGADLTDANLEHVWKASTFVWDAISATLSARMALKKTRIEWEQDKCRQQGLEWPITMRGRDTEAKRKDERT